MMKYSELYEMTDTPPKIKKWLVGSPNIEGTLTWTRDYDEYVTGYISLFSNGRVELAVIESDKVVKTLKIKWKTFKELKGFVSRVDAMVKPFLPK